MHLFTWSSLRGELTRRGRPRPPLLRQTEFGLEMTVLEANAPNLLGRVMDTLASYLD